MEISPVLADAIGLRRENVPQNKFLLRIGWGEGGRRPDEVNCEIREIFLTTDERGLTLINFPRTILRMANQAEQPSSPKMSLKQLRDSLTPQQRKLITSFWKYFADSGEWPKSVEIHRKYEKETTANCLRSIGGEIKRAGKLSTKHMAVTAPCMN
jgi:hypothetical protein